MTIFSILGGGILPAMIAAGRMHGINDGRETETSPAIVPEWVSKIADTFRVVSTIIVAISMGIGGAALCTWAGLPTCVVAIAFLQSAGFSAWAFMLGHGRFFAMQGANLSDPKPEWIETHLVLPWYPGDIAKPIYSWVCMGIKGALFGLGLFPFGLVLALAWPVFYAISFRTVKDSNLAEYLTVGYAGMLVTVLIHAGGW